MMTIRYSPVHMSGWRFWMILVALIVACGVVATTTATTTPTTTTRSRSKASNNNEKNYDNDNDNDDPIIFPHVLTVHTTRTVAGQLSQTVSDVLFHNSRRLLDHRKHPEGEAVELNVVIETPEQLAAVQALQRDEQESEQNWLTIVQTHPQLSAQQQQQQHRRRRYRQHRQVQAPPASTGIDGSPLGLDLTCYRTVDETYARLDELAVQYPNLVTVSSLGGTSHEGREIRVVVISSTTTSTTSFDKPNVLLVGGHHSRELPPPEVLLQFAEGLLRDYGTHADTTWLLNRTTLHIVPIANPDGRIIVQNFLWWYYRKNAAPQGCNRGRRFDGTDLNRNYPLFWGRDAGSSARPCATDYRGSQPLSETESTAVYEYVQSLFPETVRRGDSAAEAELNLEQICPVDTPGLFVDLHSWGDFIYFPWGAADTPSPNHLSLLTLSSKLAHHAGGYELWGPSQDGFLYVVSGDATDSTYGIDCIPSVGYEIGSNGFYPDCSTTMDDSNMLLFPEVQQSLRYALKTAPAPYQISLGPDVVSVAIDFNNNGRVTVTATVSDDAWIVPHANFPSDTDRRQTVAQVLLFRHTHPDDSENNLANDNGVPMTPVDGALDSTEERVEYQWQLTPEEQAAVTANPTAQVVYIRAWDTDGNPGAVSALFVTNEPQGSSIGGDNIANGGGNNNNNNDCSRWWQYLTNFGCCVLGFWC